MPDVNLKGPGAGPAGSVPAALEASRQPSDIWLWEALVVEIGRQRGSGTLLEFLGVPVVPEQSDRTVHMRERLESECFGEVRLASSSDLSPITAFMYLTPRRDSLYRTACPFFRTLSPITYFDAVPERVLEAFGCEIGTPRSVVILLTSPEDKPKQLSRCSCTI